MQLGARQREQSIFKTPESSFFTFERSDTHTATSSNSNMAQDFFAPITSHQRMGLQQSENSMQSSNERLSSLHSKLHQEAEKIRKWKMQTEVSMKQKDKKILEGSQMIESLRKSILDSQLQHENLSVKLQDEIANREEIVEKIESTRSLVQMLSEFSVKVEERMQKCETERTELKYKEKEHLTQFQDLSEKFSQLSVKSNECHNNLKNQLEAVTEEKGHLQKEYEDKLKITQEELVALQTRHDEKEVAIVELTKQLQENTNSLSLLQIEYDETTNKLTSAQCMTEEQRVQIDACQQELSSLKSAKDDIEAALCEINTKLEECIASKDFMARNFEETEKLYVEKVKCLQDEKKAQQDTVDEQTENIEQLQINLAKAQNNIEDLKCTKDMLMVERTDANNKIKERDAEMVNLQEKLNELEKNIDTLSANNVSTLDEMHVLRQKHYALENDMQEKETKVTSLENELSKKEEELEILSKKTQAREETINHLQEDLRTALECKSTSHEEIDKMRNQLDEMKADVNGLNTVLDELKTEKQTLQKESKSNKKELTKLTKDLEKSTSREANIKAQLAASKTEVDDLRKTIDELESKLQEINDEATSKLNEEENTSKSLKTELEGTLKQASDLETKAKNMKSEITAKNKQIKELEKEVKGLKSKLTSQMNTSSTFQDECAELKNELADSKEECKKQEEQVATLSKEVEKCKADTAKIKKEGVELKKKSTKEENEKTVAIQNCDRKIQEMMDTLEQYKIENDAIVARKEKEMQLIRQQKESELSALKDKEIKGLKDEIEKIKEELDGVTKNKRNLDDILDKRTKENQEMKDLFESKNTEVESLKREIEDLKSVQSTEVAALNQAVKDMENAKQTAVSELEKQIQDLKSELDSKPAPPIQTSSPKPVQGIDVLLMTPQRSQIPVKVLQQNGTATPRTPKVAPVEGTKQRAELKTPNRSILRQDQGAAYKKRRVAFAREEDENTDSDSDSSSAELMEVEETEIANRFKSKNPQTPLLVRPSPHLKSPAARVTPNVRTATLTPVRRTVEKTTHKEKINEDPNEDPEKDEMTLFKELYPEDQHKTLYNTPTIKKKTASALQRNVKKTPARSGGKFFKDSPKQRKKPANKPRAEDISWFDSDAVFGFGSED